MSFVPPVDDVAGAIEGAADLIESVGWTQQMAMATDRYNTVIGYCAIGAISQSAKSRQEFAMTYWFATIAVAKHLQRNSDEHFFDAEGAVSHWNDRIEATREEVVDTLKEVAKDLRNNAT